LRLRTQILLFLFLFGLAPLIAAVVINLPLVLDRMELFYHKAHLQNLRADFRDLDQHLASRHEMIRLLAKLPEPGTLLGTDDRPDYAEIDEARARYTQWINQILGDQIDIIQILFLDAEGNERFWLERDSETRQWQPTARAPHRPAEAFVSAGLGVDRGGVLVSPISLDPVAALTDSRRFMTLHLISPIFGRATEQAGEALGAVVLTIDVGGMAEAYRDTLWVINDGAYLEYGEGAGSKGRAFEDFPGLEALFENNKLALWEGGGRQVIWVPMFVTENGEPLWVGRNVDPSPLADFRRALILRVLAIVLALIVAILLMARWVALRTERFGRELTEGVTRMLREDEAAVSFSWRGSAELQELSGNLSRLAESHARHNRALRQHARELEQSNRYKSEFLANVSHELRTPLNSILLLSKMLAGSRTGLSSEQTKQAEVIHRAGSDLLSLIDNILDISRIEAGQARLHLETIDLEPLLQELIELVQPQFTEKGLSLNLVIDPGAPRKLVSDSEKLRQILKNFLANAVKFTEQGECTIRVSGNSGADGDACPLRISVKDTGIGIPLSKQGVIFEAFKQADGSTSRRFGGTGLGLTISRELAALIGGRIVLDSEAGRGAEFALLLPLEFDDRRLPAPEGPGPAPDAGGAEAEPEPETPQLPAASFAGRCVLLVEREVRNLLQLTPVLEAWGMRVTAACDGEEALETLREEGECSLVLMDVTMPDGEGYDTIERIRSQLAFAEVPVIALAEGADTEERARCRAAGADDLVAKPVDPVVLKESLERFL
jgi:signal transduction histidine kinase/CheY-like chemotaxis protein